MTWRATFRANLEAMKFTWKEPVLLVTTHDGINSSPSVSTRTGGTNAKRMAIMAGKMTTSYFQHITAHSLRNAKDRQEVIYTHKLFSFRRRFVWRRGRLPANLQHNTRHATDYSTAFPTQISSSDQHKETKTTNNEAGDTVHKHTVSE